MPLRNARPRPVMAVAAAAGLLIAGLVPPGPHVAVAQSIQDEADHPHAYPREGVTKRFENERVIIWEVVWLDGVAQPYHRHRYDMTGVFLRWGPLRVTRPDGTFTVSESPFEVPGTFLLRKGVTHKEEGTGQPERHSIMIDLKDHAAPPRETRADVRPAFPRNGATLVLDEDRVAVWDVELTAGDEVPLHVHSADTVAVFLAGGTIRSIEEDGTASDATYEYKDVRFWPAGRVHREVVVDGSPRAYLFELKD